MSKLADQEYLRRDQYRDSKNLGARIRLHELYSTNPYPWHRWVFDQFEFTAECLVLEVGCGPGELWAANADRLPQNINLTLADLSMGMLLEAREKVSSSMENDYLVLDAGCIPLMGDQYDMVIANHMLYHLPDIDRGIREIARVLNPGGRLYAATNGTNHMSEIFDMAHRFVADIYDVWPRPDRFRLEDASSLLSPYFENIEVAAYESDLEVTEWSPLEAYIRSMSTLDLRFEDELIHSMRGYVNSVIEELGSFHITKSQGLVIGELG